VPAIVCKNCALRLARIARQRYWWFSLVREPLVLGMRILAWRHGIDANRQRVGNKDCQGCIRFMKAELEQKSATFRFLNGIVGKPFTAMRDSRLTAAELAEAKQIAADAMARPMESGGPTA